MTPPPQRRRGLVPGLLLLGCILLPVLLLPWLPLEDPASVHLDQRLAPPAWWQAPVLGTDLKGRDLLARVLQGGRVSLLVGALGTLVALAVGLPWGLMAGWRGGRTDRLLMRLADALESVPLVVVVAFLLAVIQSRRDLLQTLGLERIHVFFAVVGLLFWVPAARVVRAETLRLRHAGHVLAARATGAGTLRLLRRHVLPGLLPALLALLTLTVPRVILAEAFLSFLGLGVEPPAVSWGLLAAEGLAALNPLVSCWWLLAVPAVALCGTLLALNLLGDALAFRADEQ